ncbi:hypothetical protein AB0K09_04610 [Streptomyces sp. NPDC049577]|uniref:hypothetical protein n=1 Tax=Streptomyces sp. NPDC049577 TaxID=3155153 RepID=UPI00341B4598
MRPLICWLMAHCVRPALRALSLYGLFYVPNPYTLELPNPFAPVPRDRPDPTGRPFPLLAHPAAAQGPFEAVGAGWPDHRAR